MTYTIQRLLPLTLPRANFIETHDLYGKHSVFVYICGKYVLTYGFGFKVTLISRSYIILLWSGEQKLFAPALHKFKIWGVSTAPRRRKRPLKKWIRDFSMFIVIILAWNWIPKSHILKFRKRKKILKKRLIIFFQSDLLWDRIFWFV